MIVANEGWEIIPVSSEFQNLDILDTIDQSSRPFAFEDGLKINKVVRAPYLLTRAARDEIMGLVHSNMSCRNINKRGISLQLHACELGFEVSLKLRDLWTNREYSEL